MVHTERKMKTWNMSDYKLEDAKYVHFIEQTKYLTL